jgi:hypothetical protein
MIIRHMVARANVDPEDGTVTDPSAIRHGIIVGRRVGTLAGLIDPLTHLNLDFPEHRATACVIVEGFELKAPVLMAGDEFAFAVVHPAHYRHLGRVNLNAEREAWHEQFAAHRKEG